MPAAELTRLRVQINALIDQFTDPNRFRIGLRDLFEMYANLAYRPGQTVLSQSLLPSYRTPKLVMRQLELQLGTTCQERPDDALAVIETLWGDTYLEPRQLSVVLLGAIPASHSDAVVNKIEVWAQPDENSRMLNALFQDGTATLRRSAPKKLLALIEDWVSADKTDLQALGVRALVPLVRDKQFENLPPVYGMLSPLLQYLHPALQTDLQIAIEALAQRSPMETIYFLRQSLNIASTPATARLIRRCLPAFAPDQQASLRAALQASLHR